MDRNLVMPHLLARRAEENPDRIFIREVDGRACTYSGMHESILTWADAFRRIGVGAGDTVLTMYPTMLESHFAWLGLAWLKALEVPVNTHYKGHLLKYIINNSEAKFMVASEEYLGVIVEVADSCPQLEAIIVPDCSKVHTDLPFKIIPGEVFLAGATPARDLEGPEHYDIASIIYTSGTTGPSKGVFVPWAQLHSMSVGTTPPEYLTPDDVVYLPFPTSHISGKNPLYVMLLCGGSAVIRKVFSTNDFFPDVRKYGCTLGMMMFSMALFLNSQPEDPGDSDHPMRKLVMVPPLPNNREFEKRFNLKVRTLFNMTEISCPITSDGYNIENPYSSGRVRKGFECRVVNDFDEEVPVDQPGELIVRSDEPWRLNAGYWKMPEATAKAWRNGWFHTGDIFSKDHSGNYFFIDRKKDYIRRRGENISSRELETIVDAHPDIVESAAIGVPSEWGEEDVKLIVVLKPGLTIEPAGLIEYLKDELPRFMIPRYIEYMDELPKTLTAKVLKTELRKAGITANTWDREKNKG